MRGSEGSPRTAQVLPPQASKERPMPDKPSGAFEQKVARLEAIVKELESGNVELDRAVQLFKEGKTIAAECETLLKGAQEQIDKAMGQQAAAPQVESEIPF
jgi:exodeoxyribonuclease VII small subunit